MEKLQTISKSIKLQLFIVMSFALVMIGCGEGYQSSNGSDLSSIEQSINSSNFSFLGKSGSLVVKEAEWDHEKETLTIKGKSNKRERVTISDLSGLFIASKISNKEGEWKLRKKDMAYPPCSINVSTDNSNVIIPVTFEEGSCLLVEESSNTEPVITEPANEPVVTVPTSEPVITDPVVTEPATEPVVTVPTSEPVVTEPVVTVPANEPVVTVPANEPVVTNPSPNNNGSPTAVIKALTPEEYQSRNNGACSAYGCGEYHVVTDEGVTIEVGVAAFGQEWATFHIDTGFSTGDIASIQLFIDGIEISKGIVYKTITGIRSITTRRPYCDACTTQHIVKIIATDSKGSSSEAFLNVTMFERAR